MREIKFRAWDKQNSIMIPSTDVAIMPIGEGVSPLAITGEAIRIRPDNENFIIMQYTGLRDKNGVEIYEGDIITSLTDGYGDNDTMTVSGRVYWNDEDASFMIWGWARTLGQVVQKEVIGNIHENPELLNQEPERAEGARV